MDRYFINNSKGMSLDCDMISAYYFNDNSIKLDKLMIIVPLNKITSTV